MEAMATMITATVPPSFLSCFSCSIFQPTIQTVPPKSLLLLTTLASTYLQKHRKMRNVLWLTLLLFPPSLSTNNSSTPRGIISTMTLCSASSEVTNIHPTKEEDGENNSNHHAGATTSKTPLKVKIDDKYQLLSRALMAGNVDDESSSTFSQILHEQISKQNEVMISISRDDDSIVKESQQSSSSSSSSPKLNLKYHPSIYGGVLAIFCASIITQGSIKLLEETLIGVTSTLAIAWLPALILGGGWIEILSMATMFARPTIRAYVRKEIWPIIEKTFHKIIIAETWKYLWMIVLSPLPKPLFVPRDTGYLYHALLPNWVTRIMDTCNRYVDKFAQSMIKKVTQQSVEETFGIMYSSIVGDSIIELSIVYDNEKEDVVDAPNNDDDGATEANDDASLECEAGVCSL